MKINKTENNEFEITVYFKDFKKTLFTNLARVLNLNEKEVKHKPFIYLLLSEDALEEFRGKQTEENNEENTTDDIFDFEEETE